jgi:O-phosphoseryl-tRNA(Cys) synthetase
VARPALDQDKILLERQMEELRKKEAELRSLQEKMERRAAQLPREIEERERKQREMIKLRALATATYADGFSKIRDKRHAPLKQFSSTRRMTRPEQRSARIQFLMLCVVLAVILVMLWKSLP